MLFTNSAILLQSCDTLIIMKRKKGLMEYVNIKLNILINWPRQQYYMYIHSGTASNGYVLSIV